MGVLGCKVARWAGSIDRNEGGRVLGGVLGGRLGVLGQEGHGEKGQNMPQKNDALSDSRGLTEERKGHEGKGPLEGVGLSEKPAHPHIRSTAKGFEVV